VAASLYCPLDAIAIAGGALNKNKKRLPRADAATGRGSNRVEAHVSVARRSTYQWTIRSSCSGPRANDPREKIVLAAGIRQRGGWRPCAGLKAPVARHSAAIGISCEPIGGAERFPRIIPLVSPQILRQTNEGPTGHAWAISARRGRVRATASGLGRRFIQRSRARPPSAMFPLLKALTVVRHLGRACVV